VENSEQLAELLLHTSLHKPEITEINYADNVLAFGNRLYKILSEITMNGN
jgi:hypothetical protein